MIAGNESDAVLLGRRFQAGTGGHGVTEAAN